VRLRLAGLLVEDPESAPIIREAGFYAVTAVELDEPGALTARINLKLSDNARFQDRPGACKLVATAVFRGDRAMAAPSGVPRPIAGAAVLKR
jgi:hypothetical protein